MACGTDGDGTIFEITPAGTLTTVLNLNGIDGAAPFSEDWHRNRWKLLRTTQVTSNYDCGTIFEITPGYADHAP